MQNNIKKEELLEELETAIKDFFVATVSEEEGKLILNFVNGQKFCVSIEEL